MSTRCRLTRLVSAHRNLRTNEIEGSCDFKPEAGQPFSMIAAPLNSGYSFRAIQTTEVLEVLEEGQVIKFKTVNSDYKWEPVERALSSVE